MDVLLCVQVEAEVVERRLERGEHAVGRVHLIELARAEEARHVPRPRVAEADPEPRTEQPIAFALPQLLGVVEDGTAFLGE